MTTVDGARRPHGEGLWRPASGCGPTCLPPRVAPDVSLPHRAGRLLGVLGMLLIGAGMAALLPVLPAADRRVALRGWARGTLRALGVRLVVRGRPPRRRALLVANHVSWLDVLAVLAVSPARMLAKREVRAWPVVGVLAAAAGTVFVDRSRPRDLPATVARVADTLRAGHPVAVFPEGTTWCGAATDCRPARGFRPAIFEAAVTVGAPVVPLSVGYRYAGDPSTLPAFLGEETLWASVRRVLAARDLTAAVTVAAALHPAAGADRRLLARAAEAAIHRAPPHRFPIPPAPPVLAPSPVPPAPPVLAPSPVPPAPPVLAPSPVPPVSPIGPTLDLAA
ncbi:lysophospholipid acyltransferase family protein [Micromonospora sp. WMMD975]|uniref:lysophospholipid acyltransferase family protein n=1 Tax=Micromonospora sp. WMMD975 TaxID=3016087 RepID=UPI00249B6736|nr:lysophospholipid acyltransferase family protein [Micromonospora sp. WMMD975]WFE31930.1 lysophospholipid acyltransferase family protein [Micromonospora sp. WMMD975]